MRVQRMLLTRYLETECRTTGRRRTWEAASCHIRSRMVESHYTKRTAHSESNFDDSFFPRAPLAAHPATVCVVALVESTAYCSEAKHQDNSLARATQHTSVRAAPLATRTAKWRETEDSDNSFARALVAMHPSSVLSAPPAESTAYW
eukprot:TRINITY_DN18533_c0_g2_i2.p2 TRINITY_DN18533_c0_g2~~TRINITY_DN18533_c0_g2_i2.p2  ORF type:complete len:147 (+),score=4.01 TRINITY_DN18533_c0_g2_i2:238-678(+)